MSCVHKPLCTASIFVDSQEQWQREISLGVIYKQSVPQYYQNHLKKINKAMANGTICGLPSLSDISHLLKKYQDERKKEKVYKDSVNRYFKVNNTCCIEI